MEGNWSECMCKDLLSVKTQKWVSLACWCDAGRSAEKMTKVCQEGKSLLKDKNSITRTFSLPRWWQVQSLKRHKKGTLQLSMWSTGVLTWIVQAQCVTSAVLREGDSLCFLPDALHCTLPYIVLWGCQCLYHNCKALIALCTVSECMNASCTSHFPLSTNTETPLLHCILVVFALSRN